MKLSRKLTLALMAGILLVMAGYALFQVSQEIRLSTADLQRARHLGLAWLGTLEAAWEREGPERAGELVESANQRAAEVTLRLVPPAEVQNRLSPEDRQLFAAGDLVRRIETDAEGTEWLHVLAPLRVSGPGPAPVVELVELHAPQQDFIDMSHLGIGLATLAIVAVCGAIASWLQYRMVGRPLEQLRDKIQRVGGGDFERPLSLSQRDEIGELAQEFDLMCERLADANRRLAAESEARLAALEQMRHTDRLATVGQLAAGVAHELGTPLNVVTARAQLIGAEATADEVARHVGAIVEQCDRMTDIIQQLLDFSRRRGSEPERADLRDAVRRVLDMLSTAAGKAGVTVVCREPPTDVPARVDQNQIQQALTNIVLNGIQATRRGGRLTVTVGSAPAHPPDRTGDSEHAFVRVEDEGTGISAEHLSKLFEPFFTTKSPGEGTGLGLAVAHGIVEEHGGWIAVESKPGRGSCFAVFLPAVSGASAGVAAR